MLFKRLPRIQLPLCPQSSLEKAARTLEACYQTAPVSGLVKGFFAPGGQYGPQWWSLDYALAVEGAKWLDFSLAEGFIDNLCAVQCPDGRIKLYGADDFSYFPNVKEPIASLPKYFETAYQVALMHGGEELTRRTLDLFQRSLDWWFANRQDPDTKLISAVFEETFIPNTVSSSGVYAPMDTNIEIATGCRWSAQLAELCGRPDQSEALRQKEAEILRAVETYLWNEERGCYYPYLLSKGEQYPVLMASTFLGFALFDGGRHERLLALLRDDTVFNWDTRPLTSVSRKDPLFTTVEGPYNGNPAWSGSVWTLTNDAAIKALRRAGREAEAAALMAKTIEAFRDTYTEFLDPFTGSGQGVQEYAWTAAQFLRIIIEELFGVSYSCREGVVLRPCVPEELANLPLSLEELPLPDGRLLSVELLEGRATVSYSQDR